jgi:hypothetical protein
MHRLPAFSHEGLPLILGLAVLKLKDLLVSRNRERKQLPPAAFESTEVLNE